MMKKGSLVIVGTGIKTVGHLTMEAVAWLEQADRVLYVVGDPVAEETIRRLNPDAAESLYHLYGEGKPRMQTYMEMVARILECVRDGMLTCGAFYGHPGVFAFPSHESIRQARAEGYEARMLPGISAEDCLFADLGVDPAMNGCQSYEATDFLMNGRRIDPSSQVVLWQIGVVGDWTYKKHGYDLSALPLLIERLCQSYSPFHEVFVYEAAVYPNCGPVIRKVPIHALAQAGVSAISTLYIPPAQPAAPDMTLYRRLGLA